RAAGQAREPHDAQQWERGKGPAIAATGAAAAGTVAAVSTAAAPPPPPAGAPPAFASAPATPPPPPPPPPCANATTMEAGGISYSKCGSAWYTQAYGADGVTYVQTVPPPGS